MKLNRKWLLAIALVLSLTMAISGTLAYLTDRDTVENVFTMGNVDIEVEEEFDQNSPLYPGVEVDKKAGITNTHATEPAYVWMVVSVPNDLAQYIELGWAGSYSDTEVTSPHDGYTGYLVKYPTALTAGSSTGNILETVKLAENVDYQNGQYVAVSGGQTTVIGDLSDVKIMVDGFAIQTEGFDGVDAAYTAYTTQWGGLTGGESGTGSEGGEPETLSGTAVATADQLVAALANGGDVYLTANIDMGSTTLTIADNVTLDLNGYVLKGTCDASQGHLIMVQNDATLNIKDSSSDDSGKITYVKGNSNTGWAIDLEGALNLYAGTIELTGEEWSIGYAVDVRPNAWGTNYTQDTVFHMYGGKINSSDGAIRVASSSSDTYSNIVAKFIMDDGVISAAYDGVFIQQSNAAYDTLTVNVNAGTIVSDVYPIRFYAPVATSVNSGASKPMTLTIGEAASVTVSGSYDTSKNWYKNGVVAYGQALTVDILNTYATITIAE